MTALKKKKNPETLSTYEKHIFTMWEFSLETYLAIENSDNLKQKF